MSESNPIKIPPPVPATPKPEPSSPGATPNEQTAPIHIQFPKQKPNDAKASQQIRIPAQTPSAIPSKSVDSKIAVPEVAPLKPKPIAITIPKAELRGEGTSRMGNWFKPKKTESTPEIPAGPAVSTSAETVKIAPTASVPVSLPISIPPLDSTPVSSKEEKPKPEQIKIDLPKENFPAEKKQGDPSEFPWVARDRSDEKPELLLPVFETTPLPIVKKEAKESRVAIPAAPTTPSPSPAAIKVTIPTTPVTPAISVTPSILPIEKPKEPEIFTVGSLPPFIQSTSPSPLAKPMEPASPEKKEKNIKQEKSEKLEKTEQKKDSVPEKIKEGIVPPAVEAPATGLLSRKRYEEKGLKSEVPLKEPKTKKSFPLWLRIIILIFAFAAIAGAGYAYYLHNRETKLVGKFSVSNLRLDKKIYIVNNFSSDVRVLASEYKERLQPVRDQIKDREEVVRRARGDVTSIEERIRIVDQERGTIQKEIDLQMEAGKSFQKRIWDTEGVTIEKEYDKQLDLFQKGVQERVKGLQIKWEPGELRSPEVWANAFRLGLYDAPKAVKNVVEREWIEKELQKWRDFEKKWEVGKENIRDRIDQNQEKINEKVISLKDRAQILEIKIGEANQELSPLKTELVRAEGELKESQDEEKSFLDYYYKQILELPEKNIRMTIDLRADNTFTWGRIHENKAFPAGNYLLYIKGKKGDEDCWTMIEFPLIDFHKTEIEVTQSAFVSLLDYLKK